MVVSVSWQVIVNAMASVVVIVSAMAGVVVIVSAMAGVVVIVSAMAGVVVIVIRRKLPIATSWPRTYPKAPLPHVAGA